MTVTEQAKADATQVNALWNQAILEDIRFENQKAMIRHSAGQVAR